MESKNLKIFFDKNVYPPSEDTYLFLECLLHEDNFGKVLEIGVGTGILSISIAKKSENVTGVDLNPKAVEVARKNAEANKIKAKFFKSDLFERVRGKFDTIIFNPPYLPNKNIFSDFDLSYHGGIDGRETIDRFLEEFEGYLNPEGRVYLLQSSLSNPKKTFEILKEKNFKVEVIGKKNIFFETLYVLRVRK